eukprot:1155882-Pelagomonas_calceolata.AAC.2
MELANHTCDMFLVRFSRVGTPPQEVAASLNAGNHVMTCCPMMCTPVMQMNSLRNLIIGCHAFQLLVWLLPVTHAGPVETEVLEHNLPVKGTLPAELNGAYMRNGSNPYYDPYCSYHWFEGSGVSARCVAVFTLLSNGYHTGSA